MKTIIIDDEAKARKTIMEILKYSDEGIEIVAEADGVETGFEAIMTHKPELVLLDINMPDGSGFDLLKKLPSIGFKLIFITAFEQFAIKAFEFSALDYILKPINPMKLINSVKRVSELVKSENLSLKLNALFSNLNMQDKRNQKIVLHTEKRIHIIETKNIVHCQSDGGYTTFYLIDNKKITVSRNLKTFEELLSNCNFFRTHQSYLINVDYIDYYNKHDGGYITMQNGIEIPVAQRKKEQFLSILEKINNS